jgi:hypothetical protein
LKDRLPLVGAAIAASLMVVAAASLIGGQGPADASTLSRSGRGWLAARRYLEARGCQVTLLDRELDVPEGPGVLVLAFPWQRFAGRTEVSTGIDRHLQSGGTLLFAYSGSLQDTAESLLAERLDLEREERRGPPPLDLRGWRAYAAEEWSLVSFGASPRPGRIAAVRNVPRAPRDAAVLARDGQGRSLAFSFPRFRGRVVVVPADAFSNARLGQAGNADLLESLRQDLGDRWVFDEFHHGLRAPATAQETGPQRALLLYVLQVAFVYVLVALAVARRFGPAWTEPVPAAGSAAHFLLGLGALHHRLGHHGEAGSLLVERARAWDGRVVMPVDEGGAGGAAFLALARRVGIAQQGRGKGA